MHPISHPLKYTSVVSIRILDRDVLRGSESKPVVRFRGTLISLVKTEPSFASRHNALGVLVMHGSLSIGTFIRQKWQSDPTTSIA